MLIVITGHLTVVHGSAVIDHVEDTFEDFGGLDSNPGDGCLCLEKVLCRGQNSSTFRPLKQLSHLVQL